MSRLIRIIALTAVVFTTFSAVPKDSVEAASPRTSVVIDSRPEHAEILVNGKFVGTTPLSYGLKAGEHRIELKRHGYGAWERALTVSEKTPTKVVAILQPSERPAPCGGQQ